MLIDNKKNITKEYLEVLSLSIPLGHLPVGIKNPYFNSMDIYERRRLRLLKLIKERCNGINAEFARRINKDETYINRLCYPPDKKGRKNIGDEIIESSIKEFCLPHGWFDCEPDAEVYETNDPHMKAMFDMLMNLPKDKRPAAMQTLGLIKELSEPRKANNGEK